MKNIKLISVFIIFSLVCMFVYLIVHSFIEPKAYDYMIRNFSINRLKNNPNKQVFGNDNIILIMIDKETITKYRWPWKREKLCKIFDYFSDYAKPKLVVYDSLIVNYDTDNPDSDKKFFSSIKKATNNLVVGFAPLDQKWEDEELGKQYDTIFANKYSFKPEDKTVKSEYIYQSMLKFPDKYLDAVSHTGSVRFIPGDIYGETQDDIFRTYEYILKYDGKYYPSLALKTFMLLHNNPKMVLTDNEINFPELNYKIRYKNKNGHSYTPLRFYRPYGSTGYSHLVCPAVYIMDSYDNLKMHKTPMVNPELFKDKIVIIGTYVPGGEGQDDNKNTPVMPKFSGADCQATAIDNVLNNDFLTVIPVWCNIILTVFGMCLVYWIIYSFGIIGSILRLISLIVTYFGCCATCFYFNTIIDVITPIVLFVMTMLIAYMHKFLTENKNKEKVKSAMGKYVSEDIMQQILQNIDNLGLGGKKAEVTVLFADIRNFTSMSEKMTAQQVSELLNEYFTAIEPVITQNNGIINKFIGDAVMAVFGEPIQNPNHPYNAVNCALMILDKLKELNEKWRNEEKPEIRIGVGINTGEVFIGNIGSERRMEYTVIGDTVNLASRLESYNKIYKTLILISPTTYECVKNNFKVNEIQDVEIRGKAEKINIYEVLNKL